MESISWPRKNLTKNWSFHCSEIDGTLYFRAASELLRKQIESVRDKDMCFEARSKVSKSRPMIATVSVSACNVVEHLIKCSSRLISIWKTSGGNKIKSVVGCVQNFATDLKPFWRQAKQHSTLFILCFWILLTRWDVAKFSSVVQPCHTFLVLFI